MVVFVRALGDRNENMCSYLCYRYPMHAQKLASYYSPEQLSHCLTEPLVNMSFTAINTCCPQFRFARWGEPKFENIGLLTADKAEWAIALIRPSSPPARATKRREITADNSICAAMRGSLDLA